MSINRASYHSHYTQSVEDDTESFELSPSNALINDDEFKFETPTVTREQTTEQTTSKPSLFLAMCRTYGIPFMAAGFLKMITDLLNFVGPQILKYELVLNTQCDKVSNPPLRVCF